MLLLQDVAVLLLQESGRGADRHHPGRCNSCFDSSGLGGLPRAAVGTVAGAAGGAVICTMTPTP